MVQSYGQNRRIKRKGGRGWGAGLNWESSSVESIKTLARFPRMQWCEPFTPAPERQGQRISGVQGTKPFLELPSCFPKWRLITLAACSGWVRAATSLAPRSVGDSSEVEDGEWVWKPTDADRWLPYACAHIEQCTFHTDGERGVATQKLRTTAVGLIPMKATFIRIVGQRYRYKKIRIQDTKMTLWRWDQNMVICKPSAQVWEEPALLKTLSLTLSLRYHGKIHSHSIKHRPLTLILEN